MSLWDRFGTADGDSHVTPTEVRPSRVIDELKARLKKMTRPQLLDLGHTSGLNIDFFVRLGCKVHVDDYITTVLQWRASVPTPAPDNGQSRRGPGTVVRHSGQAARSKSRVLISPLDYETAQFDAVLCWDLFDYFPPEAAVQAGREIRRLTREGGLLFGLFGRRQDRVARAPRRFRIMPEGLQADDVEGPQACPFYLASRDVQKIFADFEMSQTVLLKDGAREMLLRKKTATSRQRPLI